MRLKVIEGMKRQRFKLDEIKARLSIMDDMPFTMDINILKDHLTQLEKQLKQLQPLLTGANSRQEIAASKAMMQTLAMIQSITIYIGEVMPYL
jgi:DNA-binding transcriptional MerR regulator